MEGRVVYVFTAEQTYGGEVLDTIIKVFAFKETAEDYLQEFVHNGEYESILDYVKRREWVIASNNKTEFCAYESGNYLTNRVECRISQFNVE